MTSESEQAVGPQNGDSIVARRRWTPRSGAARGRVLVVEDEDVVRDAMEPLLEERGYEVWLAENGREALRLLRTNRLPDIIVLDLRMPVMDGWEFRALQMGDPMLGCIPVVAVSADNSAEAAAISAQAFLSKPVRAETLLATIGRILLEQERQASVRFPETEWLGSLGRLVADVGHEINNPLTIVMLNLSQSLQALRPSIRSQESPWRVPLPEVELEEIKARVVEVTDMLKDCQIGGDRIRETVRTLQRLYERMRECSNV